VVHALVHFCFRQWQPLTITEQHIPPWRFVFIVALRRVDLYDSQRNHDYSKISIALLHIVLETLLEVELLPLAVSTAASVATATV
jgi:hypothetical protein